MKLELAYTGQFDGRTLTAEMLNDVVESFRPEDKIPVIIGHGQSSQESFGWINSLRLEEKDDKVYLISDDIELSEEAEALMKKKKLKNWSIGITRELNKDEATGLYNFGKWFMYHLALLGASMPAIPNLKMLENFDINSESYEKKVFHFTNEQEIKKMDFEKKISDLEAEKIELEKKLNEFAEKEAEKERMEFAKQIENFEAKAIESGFDSEVIDFCKTAIAIPSKEAFLEAFNKVFSVVDKFKNTEIKVDKENVQEFSESENIKKMLELQKKGII